MIQPICNSCNTGTSALPDMYACGPRVHSAQGRVQTYQTMHVATNMLHFQHSKNLPKLIANRSAYLYSKGYSLWLWHFNSNVSTTFIYTIHPTSFNYGILLNVNEQMFHTFYKTGAVTTIDIMLSLINTVIKCVFALYNHTNIF